MITKVGQSAPGFLAPFPVSDFFAGNYPANAKAILLLADGKVAMLNRPCCLI